VVGYAKPGRDVNGLRNLIAVNQPRKIRESIRSHDLVFSLGLPPSADMWLYRINDAMGLQRTPGSPWP